MPSFQPAAAPAPLLHLKVSPSRSLSASGQVIAIAIFGAASLAVSLVFIARGYWPVAPFVLLDAGLLAFAFMALARSRRAFEEVLVDPDTIRIRRADGRPQVVEDQLPTTWTRLERDDHPEFGCLALRLRHRRQAMPLAQMLSPEERDSVAKLVSEALSRAHRGGLAAREPITAPARFSPILAQRTSP